MPRIDLGISMNMPFYVGLKIERALFDLRRALPVRISIFNKIEQKKKDYLFWAEDFFNQKHPINYLKFFYQTDSLELVLENHNFTNLPYEIMGDLLSLAKRAELLPIGYLTELGEVDEEYLDVICSLDVKDIKTLVQSNLAIEKIVATPLPTTYSENVMIHAYRVIPSLYEAYAIVFGDISSLEQVPVRIHAECFTGDLLGSLKCDCGPQLHKACSEFADTAGVIIYVRQEGRNIGLLNKMRAYDLQHKGLDTVDANLSLGFAVDERDYTSAGLILKDLGVKEIVILTNNPEKIAALEKYGVKVHARKSHYTPTQKFNENYIETKQVKIGHLPD